MYFIRSRPRTIKLLIRLRRCAGWSASLLFAYDIRLGSYDTSHVVCLSHDMRNLCYETCERFHTWVSVLYVPTAWVQSRLRLSFPHVKPRLPFIGCIQDCSCKRAAKAGRTCIFNSNRIVGNSFWRINICVKVVDKSLLSDWTRWEIGTCRSLHRLLRLSLLIENRFQCKHLWNQSLG